MCQYDTDAPTQGPSMPVIKHIAKNEIKKGLSKSRNNWWILPLFKVDMYFMIIYMCIKYGSNTLIFSKHVKQKPFLKFKKCQNAHKTWWILP